MTSSLPDFSSCPASAPANDAASLAALFPAADGAADSSSGTTPEFAALMGASSAPTAAVQAQPAGAVNCASASTRTQGILAPMAGNATDKGLSVFAPVGLTVSVVELASAVAPVEELAAPTGAREVTRDMLEEAAAFAATLLQAALPDVQLPELLAPASQPAVTPASTGYAGTPAATAQETPVASFTVASDGAIELKLDLARLKPVEFKLDTPPELPVAISAELQRSGEATVRLEAAAVIPGGDAPADTSRPNGPAGRAIFAAKYPGLKISVATEGQAAERNFVITGDKQVKSPSPVAGISVAKSETTMPVAPIEESRSPRNPESYSVLPQRAEFQVAATPAERITVPAAAPAGQNFAERAVETVTSLVETQFSASMQKSGTVQLRLQFGGEDLSVRVEVRDGHVHTDFRTDSPELRSALTREWQAFTAQAPEQMHRFLDPVFSPSPAVPATADVPSSFARSHQQAQQDLPSRTQRDAWTDSNPSFSRRSQLSDSFVPEPAAPRGPAFLPTSLRLSVLA